MTGVALRLTVPAKIKSGHCLCKRREKLQNLQSCRGNSRVLVSSKNVEMKMKWLGKNVNGEDN